MASHRKRPPSRHSHRARYRPQPKQREQTLKSAIRAIDQALSQIYSLERRQQAEDSLLPVSTDHPNGVVLVRKDGDDFSIGIQMHPWVASSLAAFGSWSSEWSPEQFKAMAVAAEEVSHFRFLLCHISENRPVSKLELETQGEIDKFLILLYSKFRMSEEHFDSLYSRIFEEFSLHQSLTQEEKERYIRANEQARNFITRLRPALRESPDKALLHLREEYRKHLR